MDIGNSGLDSNQRVHSGKVQDRSIEFPKTNNINMQISRMSELKSQAAQAISKNKIFTIIGTCEPVRTSLVKRGWIEKISANRLDVRKTKIDDKTEPKIALERVLLSNFVADAKPNLIWNAVNEYGKASCNKAKYNRIQCSHLWTTKLGLCAALQNARWSYIEDVSEVLSPRTYACTDKANVDSFKIDFKLTACTNLLKWLLTMIENGQKIFHESGTVAVNVIVFAINRCKEYLFFKENKDLDKPILPRTSNQWNSFLKKYYSLLAGQATFKFDRNNKMPLLLDYARFFLSEIEKYRPQLSCEGWNNVWIVKPADSSRGRGIKMASKLEDLTELLSQRNYIVQKYIEKPLLIYGTKFDIRQYYLISSAYPLEIWMYKDCYLKFSSQEYNIDNFHESIHLTNNAVQKKYTNCKNRHPKLPQDNMWSSDTFKEYLTGIGNENIWDKIIYPGMKKSIVGIMTTCQDSISHCIRNRFELYGCDFILDKDYKPWLIEINSCPDLKPTTTVTSVICPAVISDVIKVIIDDAPKTKTTYVGKFECIHRQTHCTYSNDAKTNQSLEVQGHALPTSYFYKGSTSQLDISSNTSIVTQPDITTTLQKLKKNHDIKQKPNINSFLQEWKSYSKYNLQDSRSNTEGSTICQRKSGIIDEQDLDSLSDSISSEDDGKTSESDAIVEQRSSLFNQIPLDLDANKRKIGAAQRFILSAPVKHRDTNYDKKPGERLGSVEIDRKKCEKNEDIFSLMQGHEFGSNNNTTKNRSEMIFRSKVDKSNRDPEKVSICSRKKNQTFCEKRDKK